MNVMSDRYFAVSGYSTDDISKPDLSVFHVTKSGQFFQEQSFHLGNNPSFMYYSCGELYVSSEMTDGSEIRVFSFSNGRLLLLRTFTYSYSGLCHIVVHNGKIFGSNYLDGVYFCADGQTGQVLWEYRSSGTGHAHGCFISESTDHLITTDLGTGEIACFSLENHIPAKHVCSYWFKNEEGPRHLLIRNDLLFCVLENSSELAVLRFNKDRIVLQGVYQATASDKPNYPSNTVLLGEELLVANRGADTLTSFQISENSLFLKSELALGKCFPRQIVLSRNGRTLFVACQKSDCVLLIDTDTMRVVSEITMNTPSCIEFME